MITPGMVMEYCSLGSDVWQGSQFFVSGGPHAIFQYI